MTELSRDGTTTHRSLRITYVILTLALVLPQIWTFSTESKFFPFHRWALFTGALTPGGGYTYYVLQGETSEGELISLPPASLTRGLTSRNYTLVRYVVDNRSFEISHPHPDNVTMMARQEQLPRGARMPDLLRAWGEIYNRRLPLDSKQRLIRVKLSTFRWEGSDYTTFHVPAVGWEVEL